MRNLLQSLSAVALTVNLAFASPVPIGAAKSGRDFRLDNESVRSNATIFDGSTVEAGAANSEMVLNSGTRVMLAPSSRGKVYSDRTLLERGSTQVTGSGTYRIEALSLKVAPDSASSVAEVGVNSSNHVVVLAKGGPVNVQNSSGVLLAMVWPGDALEFDPQAAGASGTSTIQGTLKKKDGKYTLKDCKTNVTFEVQGTGLEQYVGKMVEVNGAMVSGVKPVSGATQVVSANSVTNSTGCKMGKAGKAGAGGAAAGTVAGMSTGVFVVVALAAATGIALGAAAGAGAFDSSAPASPAR